MCLLFSLVFILFCLVFSLFCLVFDPRCRCRSFFGCLDIGAGVRRLSRGRSKTTGIERTSSMRDSEGNLSTDPDSICNIVATFYEDLYADSGEVDKYETTQGKQNRCRWRLSGWDAEDWAPQATWSASRSELLSGQRLPPESWKIARTKVIFVKGQPDLPKNQTNFDYTCHGEGVQYYCVSSY